MQKSNVNRASVCALCYQYVTHGPYCDTASATCIMSTCACNKSFVRHETGSVQRSTSQMQQLATTTYNPRRHPTCRTHHSTCNVRYATYASDGEGHEHTHTHSLSQCNRAHARRRMDGAAIPTVWVRFLAWARRATMECGGAEAANKQTTVAVGPPRRMGGGNGTPLPGRHAVIPRHSVAAVGARGCSKSSARRSAWGRSGCVYRRWSERRLQVRSGRR